MQDYEKLGLFYLGKKYNLDSKTTTDDLILYDSKDLTTHAVVVGMTGSGKTGLCVGLIEEAAIDGVPSIVIDPKGDLTNLLLTFPEMRGSDFLPWINLDDARQKNLTPQEYADKQAQTWKNGLESWGQSPERINLLRQSADFTIYTPASSAGVSVSILKSFAAPPPEILEDGELLRERISTTVTGLLALLGITADPVQSREFILLATIIDQVWRAGKDLDLAQLITQVQTPPVSKIGVLDLESFYPAKERFALVMALNNLLASPGFNAWLEGVPLDISQILYTAQGKPRVAIFSIAHLSDPERMFFVTLLLNQVLGWMRGQSGTTSLRAILYMDEIFGYLPPTSNPPSKMPMLTLFKQARAFGLGIVLATQNPVDLDYKALANAGTWFIGRLQTERDKLRVLEGLEGASASSGAAFNRQDYDKMLSGLGSRVFLLNNAHENEPVLMSTRWALSYLRGPLTRDQIRALMAPLKAAAAPATSAPAPVSQPAAAREPAPAAQAAGGEMGAPALPPETPQVYLPIRGRAPAGFRLVYRPALIGSARVSFADTKTRTNTMRQIVSLAAINDSAVAVDWEKAQQIELETTDLERSPAADLQPLYAEPAPAARRAKNYAAWTRELTNWLYAGQTLDLLQSPSQKLFSKPDEDERDFRLRLAQNAREQRDTIVEDLRRKFAPKAKTLEERLRKAQQAVEREKEQARQSGLQAVISIGATLLGALGGRKTTSASNVGRATTAARGLSRTASQKGDVDRAQESVAAIQKQMQDLDAEFKQQIATLSARVDPMTEELVPLAIRPKKADIVIQLVALAWAPYWQDERGVVEQAW